MNKLTKIKCDYCGTTINIEKYDVCPKCGASYSANEAYKKENQRIAELKKIEMESARLSNMERQANLRERQQRNNTYINVNKNVKQNKKIILIVYAVIIAIIVVGCTSGLIFDAITDIANDYEYDYNIEPTETEPVIIETPVEVGFNEMAELIQYSAICDKVEEYNYQYTKPQSGFRYVRMHLIMTNKTDNEWRIWDSMKCSYIKEGYEINAEESPIHSNDLGTKIYRKSFPAHSSTEGWVYFEVPIGAEILLHCGEYITFRIPTEPPIEEIKTDLKFNQEAEMIQYSVICDKIEEYKHDYMRVQEGFKCLKFHFVVDNKTNNKWRVPKEMICQYEQDGHMMGAKRVSHYSINDNTIITNREIDKNSSTEGWVYFEVPINKELKLIYDDYITISIPAQN